MPNRTPRTRALVNRMAATAAASLAMVLALGRPALAHTEIEIDNPQAGAANVTMSMTAEAESPSAGIASLRVVLPDGIPPSGVTLTSGPAGWALTPTADGFTATGASLRVHVDAKLVLHIAQLPPTPTVLAFKTLVTYADGQVDRWIEPPSAQNPNPEHPAPTVSLRPATGAQPSTPGPASTDTTSPANAPSADSPSAAAAPAPAADHGGTGAWPIVAGSAVIVALLTGTAVAVARRRRTR